MEVLIQINGLLKSLFVDLLAEITVSVEQPDRDKV